MSFFKNIFSKEKKETLDKGLEKTNTNFLSKLGKAVAGKSKVDDEVLDDLEEVLVSSDVGVATTIKIIDRIEARVAKDKYLGTEELNSIANFMEKNDFEDISSKIIWKAKEPLKIDLEQLQKVAKLIEALEDDEDVRSVTSNFEASDEDFEALSG